MKCEVIAVRAFQEKHYSIVKTGALCGELPCVPGFQPKPGQQAFIASRLVSVNGRLEARLSLRESA